MRGRLFAFHMKLVGNQQIIRLEILFHSIVHIIPLESNDTLDLSAIQGHDSAAEAPQLLALIDKGAKESKTKDFRKTSVVNGHRSVASRAKLIRLCTRMALPAMAEGLNPGGPW